MRPDPIIDEIREVRHHISEECGHDPVVLVQHYMELERMSYAERLIEPTTPPNATKDEEPV